MAIGKPRSNKRSSGGSCSSTVTTLVLLSVCVFGVWMLTSNYTASPRKTNVRINSSLVDSLFDIEHRYVNSHRKIPTDVGKDNNVDRPSNASVSKGDGRDEESNVGNDLDTIQEMDQEYKLEEEENSGETSNVVDDEAESLNDSDVGKEEAEQLQEEAKEEELETSDLVVEDGSEGKEDEKQNTRSTIRDDQETEETSEKEYDQEEKQTDIGNEDDIRDLEDNQEQETIDEEEEKTTENQQEQGDTSEDQEQHDDDGQIQSHSIAAETRAHIENQEAQDVRNKMEQAKIEPTIDNTTIPNKPPNTSSSTQLQHDDEWDLCNVTSGTDYIPCLDNEIAIRNLHHWHHDEHQERHCPNDAPLCLVPLPARYKTPLPWPQSRDKIWLDNVPHKTLSSHIKVTKEFITFPKGGTQFIHGALHYIEFLQEAVPEISWGKNTRVVLDIGCGVATFGGSLFDKDVLTMSFASKDEQEAQIQYALERGIPAISAVMGTQRLPFPSGVFDLVHCVRCGVPWHKDGGVLLLEVNRLLRPGGYFVWSATPVYRTLEEDVQIWKEMSALTVAMCWELVTIKKDKLNAIGVAVYHKPDSNDCYDLRKKQQPPICQTNDDPNAAWYVTLQLCMHKVPIGDMERGSHWPEEWPDRVQKPPYWLNKSHIGIYGKPSPNEFKTDYEHWKRVVSKFYSSNLGISWLNIRNVMDMRSVYGGFAAALKDLKLWVLNVVNTDSPDTLPIIFERGLFGIYHDWCESFSTYPRTYDLLHADHLFSKLKNRCKIKGVIAEIDRILRPGGNLIASDESSMIREIEKFLKSLHWEVNLTFTNKQEGTIVGRKSMWRPSTYIIPS